MKLENYYPGDNCPKHGSKFRKIYTYGSSMTGESEVTTYHGCKCAICTKHDPVGTYPAVSELFTTYSEAASQATFFKMRCAAKYSW